MKLDLITLYQVRIPFVQSIDHNLKTRRYSDSLVLEIRSTDNKVGYGECTPRPYVTGEETQQVISLFQKFFADQMLPVFNTFDQIKAFTSSLRSKYKAPSLVIAVETALLDLLGQAQNCNIAALLEQPDQLSLQYSAVLPYLPLNKLERWLGIVKSFQLTSVKVKVGLDDDFQHLKLIREQLGDAVDIRVDANRSWTMQEAIRWSEQMNEFNISCIEEPLIENEVALLPALSQVIDHPIMLDESVCSLEDAKRFAKLIQAEKLLFNIKLSKVGGLLNASEIHHFAKARNIACQLGCHVGETAILSAAGRIFAQTHALRYLEGSYAPFFMESDISTKPLTFSEAGKAISLESPGLGIQIDKDRLNQYSCSTILTKNETIIMN